MATFPAATDNAGRAAAGQRLELTVLILQSSIATFYCLGTALGLFPTDGGAWQLAVAWIAGYHVVHAGYVLAFRMRARPSGPVEVLIPLLDVSCITAGWVAMGDPHSALWGIYLYALVGYARRIFGLDYAALASWIGLNVFAGRYLISLNGADSAFDGNLATMLVLAAAVAVLSSAIGNTWRNAEREARRLAEVDPLTGIANRRSFLERLEELASDSAAEFSILMLDLDDFKRLNDEYGHLHGDEVLRQVARVIAGNLRADDRLARYGGEEFVVAMPGVDLHEMRVIADRLRMAIHETTPTSASIGCAAREPGETAHGVLRRADDVLLAAKRRGKNRIHVSETLRRTA